ncbi:class I SAM-dependent methyltransferase [Chloroflexota bacterium]
MPLDDSYSKKFGRHSASPAKRYSYSLRLGLIREALHIHKFTTLLDLGSATGDYAIDLAEQNGLTSHLLDINPRRLLFAASCKSEKLFILQADAISIPFRDNTFDFALMLNSLRYFSSPGQALLECRRVLRPGGHLLIIDHNKLSPEVLLLGRERTRCFTASALANLVKTNHFEVINMKMLFIPPSFIPAFLVNIIVRSGLKLASKLGKAYPEIFILAVKE